MISPITLLREAIRAVPAVKYALGIGGAVALIAIVFSFGIDARVAFVGAVVMLILMGVLVVFARMAGLPGTKLVLPALAFTWFALLLFMAVSVCLFTSVFFSNPVNLRHWITSVVYQNCRHPDFGQEGWGRTETVSRSSGWRDGGYDQPSWCNDVKAWVIKTRSLGSQHVLEVVNSSEGSSRDLLGHVTYNYHCTIKASWEPIWAERQDARCGVVK